MSRVTTPLDLRGLQFNIDAEVAGVSLPDDNGHFTELRITFPDGWQIIVAGDFTVSALEPGYDA